MGVKELAQEADLDRTDRAGARRREAVRAVAREEGLAPELLEARVQAGKVVVLGGGERRARPLGIGEGLRTKVNANIGTSPDYDDLSAEIEKLHTAVEAGADTVMDLSTGGDLPLIRRTVREECDVALGTVPVYEAGVVAAAKYGSIAAMPAELLLDTVEAHAAEGVDFLTLHCGVTRQSVERLRRQGRVCGIVSRGGSMLAHWMRENGQENPLYAQYDRILEVCRRYDTCLSLGDGLRPGALADATDRGQIEELLIIGELVEVALEAGVAVIVEGPGHVPLHQVAANVTVMKATCCGVPFYVLGPLVTDVCPGYDHIVAAIGGAVCAAAGADYLCYVTPSEHLGLPSVADVREGVFAARIAAHAADLAKGIPGAQDWDRRMSQARRCLDWDLMTAEAMDPERVRAVRAERASHDPQACSMCGSFCSLKAKSI
jgi:phosphomethylpyrimidine synthase